MAWIVKGDVEASPFFEWVRDQNIGIWINRIRYLTLDIRILRYSDVYITRQSYFLHDRHR